MSTIWTNRITQKSDDVLGLCTLQDGNLFQHLILCIPAPDHLDCCILLMHSTCTLTSLQWQPEMSAVQLLICQKLTYAANASMLRCLEGFRLYPVQTCLNRIYPASCTPLPLFFGGCIDKDHKAFDTGGADGTEMQNKCCLNAKCICCVPCQSACRDVDAAIHYKTLLILGGAGHRALCEDK